MPPSKQIRKILTFDAFNTLFTPRLSVSEIYGQIAQTYNIKHDTNRMISIFPQLYKTLNQKHPNYGKNTGISYEKWWFELIDGVYHDQLEHPSYEAFRKDLYDSFKSDRSYTTFADLRRFLELVGGRDDTVLLCLSNGDPRVRDILNNLDLMKYFGEDRRVKLSYDLDLSKSDPKFYQFITHEIQRSYPMVESTKDIWHFGDEVVNDMKNSNVIGWNSILVDRTGATTAESIAQELSLEDSEDVAAKRRLLDVYFTENQSGNIDKDTAIKTIGDRLYLIRDFKDTEGLIGLIYN
ncbi:hypothetical protein WICPIJ_009603 [Wickerhamomyces pijperi]|uniref:Haloacid dehalogenase-like hydrolase n=1 Tax=Wickerhamomyces pijperi TaxID=599730 RepID=A0A9P8PMQ2_WICPI|nr:hypothetical protein WICPIJ_009603 [Wickerhamomyces pijperi]